MVLSIAVLGAVVATEHLRGAQLFRMATLAGLTWTFLTLRILWDTVTRRGFMNMFNFRLLSFTCLVLSLVSCGPVKETTTEETPPTPMSTDLEQTKNGCLQGHLQNAFTELPVTLPTRSTTEGIFVLVRNILLPAISGSSVIVDSSGNLVTAPVSNLVGDYAVCHIPLDQDYPFYAIVTGYLPFRSNINIPSTIAERSTVNAGAGDIVVSAPTLQGNVRLFPLGTARDFVFNVSAFGAPVVGASVVMTPTYSHIFAQTTHALPPSDDIENVAVSAVSDSSGKATLSAASLVYGMQYRFSVIPPQTSTFKMLSYLAGNIHAGVLVSAGQDGEATCDSTHPCGDAWSKYVDLSDLDEPLALISSSLATSKYDITGKVSYFFNRPIEVVRYPSTGATVGVDGAGLDGLTFALSSATCTAVKAANAVGTPWVSEQVTFTISGNQLTLTPVFITAPPAVPTSTAASPSDVCKSLAATYTIPATLFIRAKDDFYKESKVDLSTLIGGAVTMNFYEN